MYDHQKLHVYTFGSDDNVAPVLHIVESVRQGKKFMLDNAKNIAVVADFCMVTTDEEALVGAAYALRGKFEHFVGVPSITYSPRFLRKLMKRGATLIACRDDDDFKRISHGVPDLEAFCESISPYPNVCKAHATFEAINTYVNAVARYVYDVSIVENKDDDVDWEMPSLLEWKINTILGVKLMERIIPTVMEREHKWIQECLCERSVLNHLRYIVPREQRDDVVAIGMESNPLAYDAVAISLLLKHNYSVDAYHRGYGIPRRFTQAEAQALSCEDLDRLDVSDGITKLDLDGVLCQLESYVQGVPFDDIIA